MNGWEALTDFTPDEFNSPGVKNLSVDENLRQVAERLQRVRNAMNTDRPARVKCRVNDGYRPQGRIGSQHAVGRAADVVFLEEDESGRWVPLPLGYQYVMAVRHGGFPRTGVYLWWDQPGLHCDIHPDKRNYWISPRSERYIHIPQEFTVESILDALVRERKLG